MLQNATEPASCHWPDLDSQLVWLGEHEARQRAHDGRLLRRASHPDTLDGLRLRQPQEGNEHSQSGHHQLPKRGECCQNHRWNPSPRQPSSNFGGRRWSPRKPLVQDRCLGQAADVRPVLWSVSEATEGKSLEYALRKLSKT